MTKVVKHSISPRVINTRVRSKELDTSKFAKNQTPTPATDGSQKVFTVPDGAYVAGTLEVYLDGLQYTKDTDWSETDAASGTFTFVTAPASDEVLRVSYIKQG